MPTGCIVCNNIFTQMITEDMLNGKTLASISKEYGISKSALSRHRAHVMAQMPAIEEQAPDIVSGQEVTSMSKALELQARGDRIYAQALSQGDQKLALQALKELREIVVLQAKLSGELEKQVATVHQHVHISPEWVSLRKTILNALEPFPAACQAVSEALERYDHEHTIE